MHALTYESRYAAVAARSLSVHLTTSLYTVVCRERGAEFLQSDQSDTGLFVPPPPLAPPTPSLHQPKLTPNAQRDVQYNSPNIPTRVYVGHVVQTPASSTALSTARTRGADCFGGA